METGTITALLRGLHLAGMMSLLGTAGFIAWMLPAAPNVPERLRRGLISLWWVSGVFALLAGLAWFTLEAATIADAGDASEVCGALPLVAQHTRFGTVLLVRLALLLVATLAALLAREGTANQRSFATYLAITAAAAALCLQGAIGHAGATEGTTGDGLLLSEALHLLAAGLWLGALPSLWLSLLVLPPAVAAPLCERFSPIGLACVLVLAGTGFAQGLELIGSMAALFGTPYGHIALLKITLFLVALALAAVNRLWLTDHLAAGAVPARGRMLVSVCVETMLGLSIVIAAAFLASTLPGAHQTPVWPFSWQFSLVTVQEDAEFRQEVLVSLSAIGAAILLLAAALLWRRLRLLALVVLLAVIAWRGPSLSLLTVTAYPTSFQTSPTGFSAAAIAHGHALFVQNCVGCHGPNGEGNGPDASKLRIRPADLTQPHIQEHSDGEMFWFLTHGIDDPEGGLAMPGFGSALSADDRWALIDYVRAHNAGVGMQQDAGFDVPVRAPNLPVTCNGVAASAMTDLRGRVVLVVLGDERVALPSRDAITLAVPTDGAAAAPGGCVAADPTAWTAFAVLADLPPDKAAGTEFLVDPNGWLRAVQRPGAPSGWHSRDDLLAAIHAVAAHPIKQPSGGPHEHHH